MWGVDPNVLMAGASAGIQNAANSLGQAERPPLGEALFNWRTDAAYLFAGAIGWMSMGRRLAAPPGQGQKR